LTNQVLKNEFDFNNDLNFRGKGLEFFLALTPILEIIPQFPHVEHS